MPPHRRSTGQLTQWNWPQWVDTGGRNPESQWLLGLVTRHRPDRLLWGHEVGTGCVRAGMRGTPRLPALGLAFAFPVGWLGDVGDNRRPFLTLTCSHARPDGCGRCDASRFPGRSAAWLLQGAAGLPAGGEVPVFGLWERAAAALPGPVRSPLLLPLPGQHPQVRTRPLPRVQTCPTSSSPPQPLPSPQLRAPELRCVRARGHLRGRRLCPGEQLGECLAESSGVGGAWAGLLRRPCMTRVLSPGLS